MIAAAKEWKAQVLDTLQEFIHNADPDREESSNLILEDEGQVNLMMDALRQVYPTCRFRRGETISAIDLGRVFGHWCCLWRTLIFSDSYLETLTTAHAQVVEVRDKIDLILSEHLPAAMKGVETGVIHFLADMNDPSFITGAREDRRKFEVLKDSVLQFASNQAAHERDPFFLGYDEAVASFPLDEHGAPKNPDKFATLLCYLRPYAMRAGLSAAEFQDVVDIFAGSQITGNPERFAKHLRRRNASLRGKGRPMKKWSKPTHSRRKKSDNF